MVFLFYRITFKTDAYKICNGNGWETRTECATVLWKETCIDIPWYAPKYDCNPQKGFSLTVKSVSSCPQYESHFNRDEKTCQ